MTIPLADPLEFPRTFIEWYIRQTGAKKYLEVGCAGGSLVQRVAAIPGVQLAVGVDILEFPWAASLGDPIIGWFFGKSDDFFEQNSEVFDVIFIDGDHSSNQVYSDLENALTFLNPDGLIVMHDTYPPDIEHTTADKCGTAYVVAGAIKQMGSLESYTFPVTYGMTLVRKWEPRPWL